jgi:hypothetical protein
MLALVLGIGGRGCETNVRVRDSKDKHCIGRPETLLKKLCRPYTDLKAYVVDHVGRKLTEYDLLSFLVHFILADKSAAYARNKI